MNNLHSFNEFLSNQINESDLYNLAADVYDLIKYSEAENKTKIRSALKKLGKPTDPITVSAVIKKIREERLKESTKN